MDTRGTKHSSPCEQNGSVTVLVVFLLPVMCIMLMLVVNIGQAIFEKIRLQQTVDMCALSAANVQAMGLNEIAELNFDSLEQYGYMVLYHAKPYWNSIMDGMSCTNFFEKVFQAIRRKQDEANTDYAKSALRVAQWVKYLNLPSTTLESVNPKDSKLMEYESKSGPYFYLFLVPCSCKYCSPLPGYMWNDGAAGDAKRWGLHNGKIGPMVQCAMFAPWGGTVDYMIKKKKNPTTYSAFKITQRPKNFILASGIFGKLDTLVAYAAAKPVGGSIQKFSPKYKGVLWKLNELSPRPDVDELQNFEH